MEKIIYEFEKNSFEFVKVMLTEYKKHELVDIRVFVKNSGREAPTKKGVCISVEFLPELKKAIELAISEIEKERRLT